jgi:glycosyltransferase involved in cell wall biosynthesis
MKIIQLITGSVSFGGAEAHVRDLAVGLRKRGHDCIVMGPREGLLAEQLLMKGVPILPIPALKKAIHPVWDTVSLFQVTHELRRLRPDILAAHTAKAGSIGRVAAKLAGVPSFFTPHGLSFISRHNGRQIRFRLIVERLVARLGGKMIAVCEAERRLALDCLGIKESDISTIHNGLPDLVLRRERDREPVVITMVARFDVQKDHATLFRALSMLLPLDWEVRLAGSGPLLPSVKLLAEECGISSRICFLGECPDTPRLLAESDIFALITNWEAFPISILESMRAGLPVIATDTGGICEAVEDGVNGFLVPQGDEHRLAERLAALITSADLRQSMGSQSRKRFIRAFEWRSMLEKTEGLYMTALQEAPVLAMKSSSVV